MKISRNWLQTFFNEPLPSAEELSHALTFHAFEIDGIDAHGEDSILDVKITANRGHDCLSHRGIAKEVSAILQLPIKGDPLRSNVHIDPVSQAVSVEINEPTLCKRYVAGYIRGVNVGPSPDWLKNALESIGQRSINNVVDATNFVMFNLGQPLHAFDAAKLTMHDARFMIQVRKAKEGEKMLALDDKEYTLDSHTLVIVDGHTDTAIGIAGVKGGKPAGISEATVDIIIESANFEGVSVRKSAQVLKLRTDASSRFEQVISPELAAYGMRAAIDLIVELAGGELEGCTDVYPVVAEKKKASVSVAQVNAVLGTTLQAVDVGNALTRLDLAHSHIRPAGLSTSSLDGRSQPGDRFEVHVPFERLDLNIPEDVVEEVARIAGYDKVPAVELAPLSSPPAVNASIYKMERIREFLTARGFSEVFTSVFSEKGERMVLNKVDGVRPYLRADLAPSLQEALERNVRNKDLLGVSQVRLFEIGTVWRDGAEEIRIEIAVEKVKKEKTIEEFRAELEAEIASIPQEPTTYDVLPLSMTERYQSYSKYPFIVRDIALWTPAGTQPQDVEKIIREEAGELLTRISLFDQFEKEGKVSYAFRLVFQSPDRTLFDEDANSRMESVSNALKERGFEIR